MGRKWTDAQLLAMNTTDRTLLVSAAAGSGKTATLTERIIRRVTDTSDPADISKMLIVTFTRSAASDLKAKIFAALGDALAKDPENSHLAAQLMKIGSAKICTIDSFYLEVVRSNFSTLGLSPSFRIVDQSEYDLLAKRIMCDCIDELYEKNDKFPTFAECFGSLRSSSHIYEIFLSLYSDLSSLPSGIEYVKECASRTEAEAELDFFATAYGDIQRRNAYDFFEHYCRVFDEALAYMATDEPMQKAYGASFAYDLGYCRQLKDAVLDEKNGYNETKALLDGYSPISLGRLSSKNASETSVSFKNLRSAFTKKIAALTRKSFSKSAEDIIRAMRDTAENLFILYDLLSLFEARITEEKNRLSLMTFSDVSRATMKLLVAPDGNPTDIARQYAEQFSDIYIDEYQDVDMVQDLIFRSISKPHNRFMVGDIKQSIYSFRGAEPKLFANYRRSFSPMDEDSDSDPVPSTIFMSNNFRCDENVIDFTNHVCSTIFAACADSIGYTTKDDLVFSKQYDTLDESYPFPKVKITVVTPMESDDESDREKDELSGGEREAEYIASEISRLISSEKKSNGEPILPGDIAVLFRSKRISPVISAALQRRGILAAEADGEKYFEDPDVLMMLCILNCIDNPQRDVYLAGALRSPIFNFTMDDLISIRCSAENSASLYLALKGYALNESNELALKCQDFINTLEIWQSDAASLAVDRFIRTLYESERFIASGLVSQTNGQGEGGNLLVLYEYARSFENGSFKGLYQFIEYINSVIEEGGTLPSDTRGSSPDRVSLMTIHKSKGLEFPVCFVVNTRSALCSNESRESLVFEHATGIALKIADGSGLARINTPMREAILASSYNKQKEEEMRVLYVSLTRARERLYLTASASAKNADTALANAKSNAEFIDRYAIMSNCTSYLDWVLLAISKAPTDSCELEILPYDKIGRSASHALSDKVETVAADTALTERLVEEFAFKYKYSALRNVPSKLSVSKLYPDILDENDTSAKLETSEEKAMQKAVVPEFFSGVGAKATSAERGTATHLFLQFCDFRRAYEQGAIAELSRLLEQKFLPRGASELIYTDELEAFTKSELMELILKSSKVIREQRFNVELSLDGFNVSDELRELMGDDKLAVQGVIDLITVNADGSISLFDYKTDRLSKAELSDYALAEKRMNDTHGRQLSYYVKAVELLFDKKCSRVCVYSTHSARLYDITPLF